MRYVTHEVLIRSGQPRPLAPANRALHSCDRPICCNPRHLRWGTQQENVDDAVARKALNQGSRNGRSRLTEDKVAEMRAAWGCGGVMQKELAAQYGVQQSMVSRIVNGRNWR